MIYHAYPADEDLVVFISRPPFEPVRYRHVKRGTTYTVVSDGEYHLNDFSLEGSLHDFPWQGRMIKCELQFSGGATDESGRSARYAGPIVIYYDEDNKFWMRATFEFHDGRFERIVD